MIQAIFIVGTGRSGTHFACRSIQGFQNIFDPHNGKEFGKILRPIAEASIKHKPYPAIAKQYYQEIYEQIHNKKILIDQHHPNLFFFNEIKKIFENFVFIFPERNVLQIVASMLNHKGVLAWYDYAKKYSQKKYFFLQQQIPFPNQFLGLTSYAQLNNLSLHELCTYRVVAHKKKILDLIKFNKNCRIIQYENLVLSQKKEFNKVFLPEEIESLGKFKKIEISNIKSLTKYKSILNAKKIKDIENIYKREMRDYDF